MILQPLPDAETESHVKYLRCIEPHVHVETELTHHHRADASRHIAHCAWFGKKLSRYSFGA